MMKWGENDDVEITYESQFVQMQYQVTFVSNNLIAFLNFKSLSPHLSLLPSLPHSHSVFMDWNLENFWTVRAKKDDRACGGSMNTCIEMDVSSLLSYALM